MSDKRGVALFNVNFLPYSETFVFEEIRRHERYDVEVFAWRRMNANLFPFSPVHVAGLVYGLAGWSPTFDRRFQEKKFSVVHAHAGHSGIYAMRYARRYNLPLVITFHGKDVSLLRSDERFKRPDYWPYAALSRRMLSEMTLGLCASTELQDLLLEFGVPQHKLRIHRLGIDLNLFQRNPKERAVPEVVMVGRLVEKKGFRYGIEAFAQVTNHGVDAHLTIVGDGPERESLQTLVQSLGVQSRVTFAGILRSAEIATLLGNADVLLCPSVVAKNGDRESGLIVAKEASAAGAVPVGTLHGGIPEIVDDGVTGYLVRERDSAQLGDRLERVLRDPTLRKSMSLAARAKMEREYDLLERVRVLETIYDEVSNQPRR